MLFPWGLWFLFFCLSGMQLSKAVLLRCSRWKIKICNGQNMGPQSPWWFVSRKPSLEMMTGAQRVAKEEKCDVTLQKSSASLQNGDEASEGCFFFPSSLPLPLCFFFPVKAGTLYSQRSLLSITQTAFENGGGGCGAGPDFLFLPSLPGPETSWTLACGARWELFISICFAQLLLDHVFVCCLLSFAVLFHSVVSALLFYASQRFSLCTANSDFTPVWCSASSPSK